MRHCCRTSFQGCRLSVTLRLAPPQFEFYDPKKITRGILVDEADDHLEEEDAKEAAEAKARDARIVELSGQEAGDVQHCFMGAYELMEGKLVGGGCVWRREGAGSEAFLYRANNVWLISDKEASMESGRARGSMQVIGDAMTPDAITEQWQVYDGASETWQNAPKITTRLCTEYFSSN